MQTEVMVALIGAAATIIAALLGLWGTRRTGWLVPALIGLLTLGIVGALGVWVYTAIRPVDQASISPSASATPRTSPSASDSPPVSYPGTIPAYVEDFLNSWAGNKNSRLAQLATAAARTQLAGFPANTNQSWSPFTCPQTCYVNENGDVISVDIAPGSAGKAQAITAVRLDRTVYPTVDTDYVKAFIDARKIDNKRRMHKLATDNAINNLGQLPAPQSYTVVDNQGAAGSTYITIKTAAWTIRFRLGNEALSRRSAQVINEIVVGGS